MKNDLKKLLENPENRWKTSRLWKVDMMFKIAQSLMLFHTRNLLHRDIKLSNFLMANDFYPVLADFGFSIDLNDTQLV